MLSGWRVHLQNTLRLPVGSRVGEDGARSNPEDTMYTCSLAIHTNHSSLHTYSASACMMPH